MARNLNDYFAPDALDWLFGAGNADPPPDAAGYVRLDIHGTVVRVHRDGEILVEV